MEEKHKIQHSSMWVQPSPLPCPLLGDAARPGLTCCLWTLHSVDLATCRQCWLMLGRQTCAGIDQRWPIMVKGICASSGSPSWLYVWANRKYRSNLKLTPAFSEVSFVFYKAVWVLMLLFRASLRPIFSPEGPGYVKVYHFRAANLHMQTEPLTHLL